MEIHFWKKHHHETMWICDISWNSTIFSFKQTSLRGNRVLILFGLIVSSIWIRLHASTFEYSTTPHSCTQNLHKQRRKTIWLGSLHFHDYFPFFNRIQFLCEFLINSHFQAQIAFALLQFSTTLKIWAIPQAICPIQWTRTKNLAI